MSVYSVEYKITYQSTTRKLNLSNKFPYDQFVTLVQTRFNLPETTTIAFTYVDSQKDIITLSTEEEFKELLDPDYGTGDGEHFNLQLQITTSPTLNLNPETLDELKILRDVENGIVLFDQSFTDKLRALVGDGSWEFGARGGERGRHHHHHHHEGRGGRGGRGSDQRGRGRGGRGGHVGGPWKMRNQEQDEEEDEEENENQAAENVEVAGEFEGQNPHAKHHPYPSHLGRRGHQAPPFHGHRFDGEPSHFSHHDFHHSYYAPPPPPHHHQHPNLQFHHHFGPSSSHPLAQHEQEHHNTHHHFHSGRRGGGHNFGGFFGAGRGGSGRDF